MIDQVRGARRHAPRAARGAEPAEKSNQDIDIRKLQKTLTSERGGNATGDISQRKKIPRREPLMSVSARSDVGAQVEVWFPLLRLDELDLDETPILMEGFRVKVMTVPGWSVSKVRH